LAIAVQSPTVKLLEARFLKKLQDYLNNKFDRSQTGFTKNGDISKFGTNHGKNYISNKAEVRLWIIHRF